MQPDAGQHYLHLVCQPIFGFVVSTERLINPLEHRVSTACTCWWSLMSQRLVVLPDGACLSQQLVEALHKCMGAAHNQQAFCAGIQAMSDIQRLIALQDLQYQSTHPPVLLYVQCLCRC